MLPVPPRRQPDETACLPICGVSESDVTVMDPRSGSHHRIPRDEFLSGWLALSGDALLIGGSPGI